MPQTPAVFQPSPPIQSVIPPAPAGPDLRAITKYLGAIVFCMVVYVALIPSAYLAPRELVLFVGLAFWAAIIPMAVFSFLLSFKLYKPVLAVVMGIMTLVPLLGWIPLLIMILKAIVMLRKHDQ